MLFLDAPAYDGETAIVASNTQHVETISHAVILSGAVTLSHTLIPVNAPIPFNAL
jgi:hypothetical protein